MRMKWIRAVCLALLSIALLLGSMNCAAQDKSYTIRVTGYRVVLDPQPQRELEEDRHLDEVLAMSVDTHGQARGTLPFGLLEEHDRYIAEGGPTKFFEDLYRKYPTTFTKIPNVEFSGSYMVISSGSQTTSRSVDGTTPAEYTVEGNTISCTFQKGADSVTLTVEVLCNGKVIASQYTTADYGVVSVATQ